MLPRNDKMVVFPAVFESKIMPPWRPRITADYSTFCISIGILPHRGPTILWDLHLYFMAKLWYRESPGYCRITSCILSRNYAVLGPGDIVVPDCLQYSKAWGLVVSLREYIVRGPSFLLLSSFLIPYPLLSIGIGRPYPLHNEKKDEERGGGGSQLRRQKKSWVSSIIFPLRYNLTVRIYSTYH